MNAPEPPASLLRRNSPRRLHELEFVNGYAKLPPAFHVRLDATPLPEPYLVAASAEAAALLGLDAAALAEPDAVARLAGNAPLPGAEPLAAVYAGHQFGAWAGRLGDGRALLLGEALGPDGRGWELQLKGAGKTPFSRMGDGRAVLRSSIREFLCSEAMDALGIPTTRALAVVGSDQPVFRETVETAAVVARMAPSFVRFGSFEHFWAAGQTDALRTLADHVIGRFYPELEGRADAPLALLREVAARTGRLIAQWQAVGFCHGVMNTDNMSILGLTIDYGPFGFIDGFDAHHVCNHSDSSGRYAYSMQPQIGEWNCYALGQALMPLIAEAGYGVEDAKAALGAYREAFAAELDGRLRRKLGFAEARPGDDELFDRLFSLMHASRADFTLTFRNLSRIRTVAPADGSDARPCRDFFVDPLAFDAWVADYRARLAQEGRPDALRAGEMNRANPKYVLRNHLAETAIRMARGSDEALRLSGKAPPGHASDRDFGEVERLLRVLRRPFDEQPENEAYAALPPDWASSLSVSCSS